MFYAISAETYLLSALMLLAYCIVARTFIFVTERVVYGESHPGHFTAFLETSTVVAAVGLGLCLGLGGLIG